MTDTPAPSGADIVGQVLDSHGVTPTERPELDITHEPYAILGLTDLIGDGTIPETYVRNGALSQIVQVSGDVLAAQENTLPLAVVDVTADALRRLLARHAYLYKTSEKKDGTIKRTPVSPSVSIAKAALSETHWPKVRPLAGVVGAPVMRPDGTVLQDPGYDDATRLYYAPVRDLARVPHLPSGADVDRARTFVLDHVLADFPWADGGSRANFVALMMTPLLRPFVGGLAPLGAVSASAPGSGKTLLTDIPSKLFGATSRPWVQDDAELRKSITATLKTSSDPVVVFDNVGEFDSVDQPTLAKLLTSAAWSDRELGSSNQIGVPNDRSWWVTGNNLSFGGDMPSRTVLVVLDPRVPNPDLRTGFTIPDLGEWLEDSTNLAELLHHLLVLARAWVVAGAPSSDRSMRNFRRWARSMAGFTEWMGVPGFMANADQLAAHDEEGAQWHAFLATWYSKYTTNPKTCVELLKSAETAWSGFGPSADDPWEGAFLTKADGSKPSARGLGKMLTGKAGRFYGEYTVRSVFDKKTKIFRYYVDRVISEAPAEREMAHA
ncbi:hypothetical protein [Nocardiopsis ganjiahuensis]|uniref:hypothetical protein n=1 Tax=Nocardiopsis ganjiahuensis TaxID=239984 RepID=UPI000346F30D|nr:hypothetical protein [Nocardiopsis ganjiahuensis]